ncbi:FecCD family ABC transporter permease [Candidatus Ruminimicrobiellum ovillum]|uniref:FecCD family ABC transporter permease n=1 Tax=Candidatus Ruminimicrobiellum ovillum TaxID=1947927 RepID=UPI003559C2A6
MNKILKFVLLLIILVITFIIAMISGISDISVMEMLKSLFSTGEGNTYTIINQIRLPRVIIAIVAGAGLACSGCVFQGVLRNPLADPFTLGISGGAAFGASIGFAFGITKLSWIFLPLLGFLGALLSVGLVYILNMKKEFDSNTMILSGVVASYIFSSAVMLVFSISSSDQLYSAFMWLMGNLAFFDERILPMVIILVMAGVVILCCLGNVINIISLGNEKSNSLGINTARTVKYIFLLSSLITACIVSCCGVIGFVGLMIPHITRKFVGNNNKVLMPFSAVVGAIFLLICDTVSRTVIAPVEIPIGVITSIIGGLFFVFLLLRKAGKISI